MSNAIQNRYTPDYVSPPGETLEEILEEREMTQAELAERMGRPKKTISEIINGKAAITPETALQLERVLGVPASFWNNREQLYREALARAEEKQRLASQVEWLDQFPVKAMIKFRWIRCCENKVEQLREVLNFFAVASPEQWEEISRKPSVDFRKSLAFQSDPCAVAAWLRQGEIEAAEIAEAGVAVVFVPQLPKTRTCGATRWLNPNKALIQLSLRYKTDDHLWFSFFHEAGHILLHGKRDVFLEGSSAEDVQAQDKEQEANKFAADTLIPPAALNRFIKSRQHRSKAGIQQFASEMGIAPGIVVGRLQHDEVLPRSHCNELKRRFKWA